MLCKPADILLQGNVLRVNTSKKEEKMKDCFVNNHLKMHPKISKLCD